MRSRPVAPFQDEAGDDAVSVCVSCVPPVSAGASVDCGATTPSWADVAVGLRGQPVHGARGRRDLHLDVRADDPGTWRVRVGTARLNRHAGPVAALECVREREAVRGCPSFRATPSRAPRRRSSDSIGVSSGAAVEKGLTTGVSLLCARTVPPVLFALSSIRIREPTSEGLSVYEPLALAVSGTHTWLDAQRCQVVVTTGVGLPVHVPAV